MASIHFLLRPSVRKGHHVGRLSIRVIHGRKVKTVALPCRLFPEEWDSVKQTVIYPDNAPKRTARLREAEALITGELAALEGVIAALEKQGRYTVDDIMAKYRHCKLDDDKLLGWAEGLAVELNRVGQYKLARAYRSVSNRLVRFNKGVDIPLAHINSCLIKGFENDLRLRGKKPNTISYYMRNLRSIYNRAIAAGHISVKQENPFAGVYTKVKPAAKRALSIDETTRLYEIFLKSLTLLSRSAKASMSLLFFFFVIFAYIWVVLIFVCPSIFDNVSIGMPLVRQISVAIVCLAVCQVISFSMPHSAANFFKLY
jgi:hypothetical protein